MPSRRVRLIVSALLVSFAVGLCLWLDTNAGLGAAAQDRSPHETVESRAADRAPALTGSAPSRRKWVAGSRRRFTLDHEVDLRPSDRAAPPRHVRIRGELAMTTAEVSASRVLVELHLVPTLVEPATVVADPADLSQPFMVAFDLEGTLQSTRFASGISPGAQRYLAAVAAAMQVSLRSGEHWTQLERDTTGEYLADYTRTGATVYRACDAYERLFTGTGFEPVASVGKFETEGGTRFELDASGQPVSIERKQHLVIAAPKLGLEAESDRTTRLRLIAVDVATVHTRWEQLVPAEARSAARGAHGRRGRDQQILGNEDLTSLLAGARQTAALDEEAGRARVSEVGYRLGALVRLQPEVARRLRDELSGSSELHHFTEAALIGGLGHAGTEPARAALTELVAQNELPQRRRVGVIVALNQQEQTSSDTARAMLEQVEGADPAVADQALLALGSMGKSLPDGDTLDPVARLVEAWRRTDNPQRREVILDALGNSADPRALPILEEVFANPTPRLHRAAVFALRGIAGERAVLLLLAHLDGRAPAALQLAALAAVRLRAHDLPRFRPAVEALRERSDDERVVGEATAVLDNLTA